MKNLIKLKLLSLAVATLLLSSCVFKKAQISITAPNRKSGLASVSKVEIINHQLIVTGANLKNIKNVKVEGTSFNENFSIESQSATMIVANSLNAVSFGVGSLFNLILADAEAAATFQIDFSLCNASLNGKGFNCSVAANNNDVLTYVAATGKWTPKPINLSGLAYVGAYNASTTVYPAGAIAGEYWIINVAGIINTVSYKVGDWLVFNGTTWDKIDNSTAVASVHGRTGTIVGAKNDYSLGLMSDVTLGTLTGADNGKVLQFNGTNWVPAVVSGGGVPGAGSISNVELAANSVNSTNIIDGSIVDADISGTAAIAQSKISGLVAGLSGKEPIIATGLSTQYIKGDKTLGTLNTLNVPELTNLYFTNTRVLAVPLTLFDNTLTGSISANDTVLQAFGRTQNQINSLSTGAANYLIKNGTDAITGVVNVNSTGVLQLVYSPIGGNDATNVTYVNAQRDTRVAKTGDTMTGPLRFQDTGINYVGLKSPATVATSFDFTLPATKGTNGQALTTTGVSGVLAWSDVATTATTLVGDIGGSIGANTIGAGKISDSHINAAAAITLTKLANLGAVTTTNNVAITSGDGIQTAFDKTQSQLNNKQSNALLDGKILVGNVSNIATPVALSGDATIVNTGVITLKNTGTAGTYRSVTTDNQGRVSAGTNPTTFSGYGLSDTSANLAAAITDETGTGALVFATNPAIGNISPLADFTLTQNAVVPFTSVGAGAVANTLVLKAGNVGIGTATPGTALEVKGTGSGFPATAGGIQSTGLITRLGDGSNGQILDIGGNGGLGIWIQSVNRSSLSTNYPLLLNPNGGNVGIGTTNPTAALHLKAGAATANGAFLKLTTGAVLTIPEPGAIEYDGTSLFYTDSTSARHTLAAAGAGLTALTGDVTASGAGSVAATVAQVAGVSAANVAAGANLANAATNLNTVSTIVKRDASGNFTAGTITANLVGNVTGNISGTAANVTGTVAVANGGTGANTLALNGLLYGNATSPVGVLAINALPSVLLSAVSGAPTWTNMTAGTVLKGSISGAVVGALAASDLPATTVYGTGTTNYVPVITATGPVTLGNSPMVISGTSVGVGATPVDTLSIATAPVASATRAAVNLSNTALVGGSANGTYLGMNPAAFTGNLIDFQIAGASKFKVDNTGKITGDGSGLTNVAGTDATKLPLAGGTMTGALINNTNNASPNAAVAVTQAGTGYAATFMGGNVGIGTTTPQSKLDVNGAIRLGVDLTACSATISGAMRFNTPNVEFCNGSAWAAFGVASSGVTSLANSISGTTPAFSAAGQAYTLNIPLAATASVTAGLLSNADYTTFTAKAPLAGPAFTGVPTAPTAAASTNTTQIATTAFVMGQIGSFAAKGANADITSLTGLTTAIPVSEGGTGLTLGTVGGIPWYAGTGTMASSSLLLLNGIVLGGGNTAPSTIGLGTSGYVLTSNGVGGPPTWQAAGGALTTLLAGYVSGAGTVAATDNILQAFQKINGNDLLKAPLASPTFTGSVTMPGTGIWNSSGNVGIGTISPTATLEVNGAIKSVAVTNASTTIDFATGNMQYTSVACGAMTLNNMKSGATYSLAVQGAAGGTCSFTATGFTLKAGSTSLVQTAGKHTIFSFMVMGSFVYMASVDGF